MRAFFGGAATRCGAVPLLLIALQHVGVRPGSAQMSCADIVTPDGYGFNSIDTYDRCTEGISPANMAPFLRSTSMGWSAVYNTLNYGPGLPDASDGSNLLDGSWTHIDVGLYMYQSYASLTTNMCGGPGMSGALSAGENRGFSGQGHLVRTSVRARVAVGCNRIPSDMTFRYTAGVAFVEPGSEPPNAAGCASAATCGPRTWPDDWTLPTDQTASFTVMSGGNGVVAHPHGGHDAYLGSDDMSDPTSTTQEGYPWTMYESIIEPGVDTLICCTASTSSTGLFVKVLADEQPPAIPPTGGNMQRINLKDFDACADGFSPDTASGVDCSCPQNYVHTTKQALLENCVCKITCQK